VYSFGITLWELLTGSVPFVEFEELAPYPDELQEAIIQGLRPTIPDRVIAIDLIGVLLVCLLVLMAGVTAQQAFLDVAMVVALISFVGTVAYARYIEREGS